MMHRTAYLAALVAAIGAGACSQGTPASETYTIADAEAIGFVKDQQQFFQLVPGATDGWDGELEGVTVELYSFAEAPSDTLFGAVTQPGNFSGWVGVCRVGNLVMLYKGEEACAALRTLEGDQ